MTWSRVQTTGRGTLAWRLQIAGFPVEFVSSRAMETMAADGRQRICGLDFSGVKLSQKADLVRCKLDATGATFKLPDVGAAVTAALNTAPSATTWLTADMTFAASSATVKSTEGFPSSGYLYLDSEVIAYSGKTSTTFTGLTRGVWNTLPQAHYVPDGAFLRYPEITTRPTVLDGRRVRLFVYGRGDDPTGDGTQVWLGVMQGDPRMQGPSWSIMVDPISRVLDAELGGDLGDPVSVRGIYYPATSPWVLHVGRAAYSSGSSTAIPIGIYSHNIRIADFFETQEAFIARVNAELATLTASWTGVSGIYCRASRDGTYHFEIQTAANPDGIDLRLERLECEPVFEAATVTTNAEAWDDAPIYTMLASTTYYVHPKPWLAAMPGAGLVPRGVFGRTPGGLESDEAAAAATRPPSRLYLGGSIGVSANTTLAVVSWDTGSDQPYSILARSTTNRSIDLLRAFAPARGSESDRHVYTPATLPQVRLGRTYDSADLPGEGTANLMRSLELDALTQINTGASPAIESGDYNFTEWSAAYDGAPPYAGERYYSSLSPLKLDEIISPDLQLLGYFLAFDSSGKLTVRRIRLASPTEAGVFAITKSNLLTDKGMPAYERGAVGLFNTVVIRDGYDPQEDRYTLPPTKVRDVRAYGRNPIARSVLIEPKSTSVAPIAPADAVRIADGVLGVFGNAYAYITLDVPLTAFASTTLGSTVSIATAHIPDATGTRGVSDLVGLVVGREIDFMGARITLTILASPQAIAGYAPSALITDQTDNGGDEWEIELDSAYFVDGDSAENHFLAGDGVYVYRFDSLTAGTVTGTVVSAVGNVVTVQFNATWTPSTDEWVLAYADGDAGTVTDHQKRYAFVGDVSGLIDFQGATSSEFVPARVFAP